MEWVYLERETMKKELRLKLYVDTINYFVINTTIILEETDYKIQEEEINEAVTSLFKIDGILVKNKEIIKLEKIIKITWEELC